MTTILWLPNLDFLLGETTSTNYLLFYVRSTNYSSSAHLETQMVPLLHRFKQYITLSEKRHILIGKFSYLDYKQTPWL